MTTHALAGQPAPVDVLIDVVELQEPTIGPRPTRATRGTPSPSGRAATGGRRATGRSPRRTSWRSRQAICDYRRGQGIDGPLFLGKDTHALSGPAQRTALEVLAANGVERSSSGTTG